MENRWRGLKIIHVIGLIDMFAEVYMSLVSHSFKVQGCVRDDKSLILTVTISNAQVLKG